MRPGPAARALGDPIWLGWPLIALGAAQFRAGITREAIAAFTEGLALFRGLGSDWGEADMLMMLAAVARAEVDLNTAARRHADSFRARLRFGEMIGIYDDLVGIAAAGHDVGCFESSTRLLGAEEPFSATFGYQGYGITTTLRERTRAALAERLGDGPFHLAWDAGTALSTEEAIAEALDCAQSQPSGPFPLA